MKKLLFILLILLTPAWCGGATYYVMPSGTVSAANKAQATACANGTALSLATMNAATFSGDDIVDGCGQTYSSGTLTPHDSGTDGHQITYRNFIITTGSGNAVFNNGKSYITYEGVETSGAMFYVSGSSAGISIEYCKIRNCAANYGLYCDGSSTTNVYNSIIASNYKGAIYSVTPASVTAQNNIIIGNGRDAASIGAFRATGTLNADYNLVTGNGQYQLWNFTTTGVTDGGHNIKNSLPKTTSPKVNKALFALTTDDLAISYWQGLQSALSPLGVNFTMFIYTSGATAQNITDLNTLHSQGNDIGIHARTHTDLSKTYPFTVTSTNTSPTVNVNTTAKTITLTSTEYTVSLDWSATDKTLADLTAACVGKNWTITQNTNTASGVSLSTLADTSGAQSIGTGYQALYNTAAIWDNEVLGTKTWVADNLGFTPTVAAPPYGATSAALRTYYKDTAELAGARSTSSPPYLSSVNVYDVGAIINQYTWFGDGSESVVRAYARGIYQHSIENGMVTVILSHSTDLTAEQIAWLVDEIQKCGGTWVLFKDLIADIKADHATADDYTYTKTYTDASDYRLTASSPAINAGVSVTGLHDVAGVTDFAGNPIKGLPDIGAYEYQGGGRTNFRIGGRWMQWSQ